VPNWIPACAPDDVEPEDVIGFAHDGEEYAVYRSPDGEYFASAGHCTHEQELLCGGFVTDYIIECPRHNGRFDYRTGETMGGPVLDDMRTYPTKVENGTVYVDIGVLKEEMQ
jgi:3-phenylpropionate/trans-cinnamate dioxygenase ferredoxin subunit